MLCRAKLKKVKTTSAQRAGLQVELKYRTFANTAVSNESIYFALISQMAFLVYSQSLWKTAPSGLKISTKRSYERSQKRFEKCRLCIKVWDFDKSRPFLAFKAVNIFLGGICMPNLKIYT